MRSSPDINLGKRVSRSSDKEIACFERILFAKYIGFTLFENSSTNISGGIATDQLMIAALSPRGILVPFDVAVI